MRRAVVFTVAILLLLGASVGAVFTLHPEWVRIQGVQLQLKSTSHETLQFQRISNSLNAQMAKYVGAFFWRVPLTQLQDVALHDHRVKSVSIYRDFPNRIRIEIEPHTPVMAFLGEDNRIFPMANDATLLPAVSVQEAADLPILRGEDLRDDLPLREKALELLDHVPESGRLSRSSISEISYTKKDGFQLFANNVNGLIKLGDSDFGPKISRVEQVLTYLESQNVRGRVIDARFSKKVVVRVRKAP